MHFVGIDLEGVLVPEIWIALAKKTGIEELKLTTRDIEEYSELMQIRIAVLKKNKIRAAELFSIASEIEPMEGAKNFLQELRSSYQVIILSDTFFNLSKPIFEKLNFPSVFCHKLLIDADGMISGMKKCADNHKMLTIEYMQRLNFHTIAIGDSYNDINMLKKADSGFLFRTTEEIAKKFPNFFICNSFDELKVKIDKTFNSIQENI